jgi:hypothetical protein
VLPRIGPALIAPSAGPGALRHQDEDQEKGDQTGWDSHALTFGGTG